MGIAREEWPGRCESVGYRTEVASADWLAKSLRSLALRALALDAFPEASSRGRPRWRGLLCIIEQSHHPAATNSIQCMHKLALVENDQQPVQRLCRVARSRVNVFFEDASCVLYGAQQHMLVRAIHKLTQTCNNNKQRQKMRNRVSSFPHVIRRSAERTEITNP